MLAKEQIIVLKVARYAIVLTLSLLAGLLSVSFHARAQSTVDDVANALIAAEDSHNVDVAVAQFAPDAVVTLPTGVFKTPDEIRGWQQELADGQFRIESGRHTIDGNTVSWDGAISLDRFRDIGIASLAAHWKLAIEGGKVKTFDFNFTPEALTELQAGSTAAALIAAESTHDVDAAVALFAPDAVVTLPTGVFKTPDEIRGWQQELGDGHFRIEPEGLSVDGDTVSWTGDISLDRFRALGIASLNSMWSLKIDNGKVETFDFTFTPDAFNKLQTGAIAAALIAAESGHDVDAAVALFADNAVVTLPTGVLNTPEAIRGWQQELADGHFRIEPEGRHVSGNRVMWTGEISLDRFRDMGIASLGGTWTLQIDNGKVTSFTFDFTPTALEKLQATPEPS
jgi:hypothetical protein